jgi:metallo-beta-lactamase family protein
LLAWFSALAPARPRVFLTHGEDKPRQELANKIHEQFKLKPTLPAMGETIEL